MKIHTDLDSCPKPLLFLILSAALSASMASGPAYAWGGKKQPVVPQEKYSREDFLLLNLNRGDSSTGSQISNSLKETREMVKGLDKGLRQIEQVDREYGKAKGKPDDHFLFQPTERLKQALKTAQQLERELESAREELKDAINQALVLSGQ